MHPTTGGPSGFTSQIGAAAAIARRKLAAACLAMRLTPNTLTVAGFAVTCLAAACLLAGASHRASWLASPSGTVASWWPVGAALVLLLAGFLDILDGAVARVGGLATPLGAILDSTVDRLSDWIIFSATALHFAAAGNATYVTLSLAALANAFLISYIKARAENVVDHCGVGYWQRGERCGVLVVSGLIGHVPAGLWLLAALPFLTVVRRLLHAARLTRRRTIPGAGNEQARVTPAAGLEQASVGSAGGPDQASVQSASGGEQASVLSAAGGEQVSEMSTAEVDHGRREPVSPPAGQSSEPDSAGLAYMLRPWRHPRGSVGYDICVVAVVVYLVAAPWLHTVFHAGNDVLREVRTHLVAR